MRLCIVAVRDLQVKAFSRPIFVPSTGVAVRSFRDEVNRVHESNDMNRHPEDFVLFQLGFFDEDTGRFENLDHPDQLALGSAMKE